MTVEFKIITQINRIVDWSILITKYKSNDIIVTFRKNQTKKNKIICNERYFISSNS